MKFMYIIFCLLVGICDCVIMEQAIQFERNKIKVTFYPGYTFTTTVFDVEQYNPAVTFVVEKTTITKTYFDKTFTKFKTEQNIFKIANLKLTYSLTERLFWCIGAGISVTEIAIAKNRISTLSPGFELLTGLRGVIFPYTDFHPSLMWDINCRYTSHRLEKLSTPEGTTSISNIFKTFRVGICLQSTFPLSFKPYVGLLVFRQINSLTVKEKETIESVDGVQDGVDLIFGFSPFKSGVVEFNLGYSPLMPGVIEFIFLSNLSCSIGLRIPI